MEVIVSTLEEMLLQNRLIQRNDDGSVSFVEGASNGAYLTVTNSEGYVTHRVERSTFGDELIVWNTATGLVEERIRAY